MTKTIDLSDLCTEGLDLSCPKDFGMYSTSFINRLDGATTTLYGDVIFDDLLLKLEVTNNIESFMKVLSEIDTHLDEKNIHIITCL